MAGSTPSETPRMAVETNLNDSTEATNSSDGSLVAWNLPMTLNPRPSPPLQHRPSAHSHSSPNYHHSSVTILSFVEIRPDDFMFAWDSKSQQWVINLPFQPLLHVDQDSRYECVKYFAIMRPQEQHHNCVYKSVLVFRYRTDPNVSARLKPFIGWLNHRIGERQSSFKHLVFEEGKREVEALPGLLDSCSAQQRFLEVNWRYLRGLESFNVAYRSDNIGEIKASRRMQTLMNIGKGRRG
ncbi:hypothetical protein BKA65DRAFT_479074 [Rhexocercosporidium sp. MPI-PUGE-AT-0058]|nr:hypothetical protein BKA65DRAFT_479074 [Rhexocercosporidium sp. MPI-PUGE-AT-0058]